MSTTEAQRQANNRRAIASGALSAIRGQQDAQKLLHALRGGMAGPDDLLAAVQAVRATEDAERLRGFCREIQKRLEAVGGAST